MIFGIGIDIIEVKRLEKAINSNSSFKEKIFTENEIVYCDSLACSYQSYAARFAAKEAFFKALGTGQRLGMVWSELEVVKNEMGAVQILAYGKVKEYIQKSKVTNIHLSISHLKEYAVANVVLEKN